MKSWKLKVEIQKYTLFFIRIVLFFLSLRIFLKFSSFFLISHRPLPPKLCLKCFFLCTVSFGEVFFSANKFFAVFGIILDQIWASVILIKKILIKKKCVFVFRKKQNMSSDSTHRGKPLSAYLEVGVVENLLKLASNLRISQAQRKFKVFL